MPDYHKIETIFERDETFVVDPTKLKMPVLGTINLWDVTEKTDGMNIHIVYEPAANNNFSWHGTVKFFGKTEKAQLPGDLLNMLTATFTVEKFAAVFQSRVDLYGEGYGAGIQKGGTYRKDKNFRLFDVLVDHKWWLERKDVDDVASKLGVLTAPYLGQFTLGEIVFLVEQGMTSRTAFEDSGNDKAPSEGVVGRPIQPLFDKKGSRIIIKLKTKDFGKQAKPAIA